MPTGDILRRKLRAAEAAQPRPPAEATVERTMQLALGRAAQQDCALPLIVTEVAARTLSLPELLDVIEPSTLLAVLEGPEDALGLVALDVSALAAIVEQQTTGAVADAAPRPRRPTRIDAAMCAPLIDLLLDEFDTGIRECARAGQVDVPPQGFRYASFIEDPRPLGLVLEDGRYRTFAVAVALGSVARPGRVMVALPMTGTRLTTRDGPPLAGMGRNTAGGATRPAPWKARLRAAIVPATASLDAVLLRVRLPLSAITSWQPGDVVALPRAHIDAVTIEGAPGAAVAQGRLGQCRGQRAVRLAPRPGNGAAAPPVESGPTNAPAPHRLD